MAFDIAVSAGLPCVSSQHWSLDPKPGSSLSISGSETIRADRQSAQSMYQTLFFQGHHSGYSTSFWFPQSRNLLTVDVVTPREGLKSDDDTVGHAKPGKWTQQK